MKGVDVICMCIGKYRDGERGNSPRGRPCYEKLKHENTWVVNKDKTRKFSVIGNPQDESVWIRNVVSENCGLLRCKCVENQFV